MQTDKSLKCSLSWRQNSKFDQTWIIYCNLPKQKCNTNVQTFLLLQLNYSIAFQHSYARD